MDERWERIDDFPDFLVSDHGRVMNNWTQNILSLRPNHQGIMMVNMTKDRVPSTRSVPLMVAKAFLEDPPTPAFNSIIHLDGDKSNCRVDNLTWRPRWFAVQYHKQFEKPVVSTMPVYLVDTDEVFSNLRQAAMKYGLLEKKIYMGLFNGQPVWPLSFEFLEYKE